MICRADTLGVFQIESRAQMSMLPRLKPRRFYDLVIEVAIVRPGPIQGNMVHPYLRRRMGKEKPEYVRPELEAILKRTLGVPLFQEQAMSIAVAAAGFSPSKADKLRRAMATFKRTGTIGTLKQEFIEGMISRNYPKEFAERCFAQIEGFGEYGFPESHAASFALLVYASCWFKTFYPDVFCAAILNSQPMGFYAPAQLVRDARDHGIEVREVDVNLSDWDCTLEQAEFDPGRILDRHAEMRGVIRTGHAVRLGFRQIKGLSEDRMDVLVARRGDGYDSVRDVWLRSGLDVDEIEKLAQADAFRSIGLDRRAALWQVRALDRKSAAETMPLFDRPGIRLRDNEPATKLPVMPSGEHVIHDYRSLGLSLKAHPVSFLRASAGCARRHAQRTSAARAGQEPRLRGRARSRAPAPRQGQCDLPDAGGRQGGRQHHRLAKGFQAAAARHHEFEIRPRDRQAAMRIGCRSHRGRDDRGSDALAFGPAGRSGASQLGRRRRHGLDRPQERKAGASSRPS